MLRSMDEAIDSTNAVDATHGLLVRIDAEDHVMLVRVGPPGAGKENELFRGVYWVGTYTAWKRRFEIDDGRVAEIILPETKPETEWIDGRPVRKDSDD